MFQILQKQQICTLPSRWLIMFTKSGEWAHDMGKFGHNHIQTNKHLS
jgi:hypothetical protein